MFCPVVIQVYSSFRPVLVQFKSRFSPVSVQWKRTNGPRLKWHVWDALCWIRRRGAAALRARPGPVLCDTKQHQINATTMHVHFSSGWSQNIWSREIFPHSNFTQILPLNLTLTIYISPTMILIRNFNQKHFSKLKQNLSNWKDK